MDAAWPPSSWEAIHTSTFLGHPVGCAMALAQIDEIERRELFENSNYLGCQLVLGLKYLSSKCSALQCEARGLGRRSDRRVRRRIVKTTRSMRRLAPWPIRDAGKNRNALRGEGQRLIHSTHESAPCSASINPISAAEKPSCSSRVVHFSGER